jgi:hypothetical protein
MSAGPGAAPAVRRRYGPGTLALLPLGIVLVGSLGLAASTPLLAWLPLLPVVGAGWAVRARVVVGDAGLAVCNGLGTRRVPWSAVEGFDVPRRGPVRLLHEGRRTVLTALPRHQLPELVRASAAVGGSAAEPL